MAQVDYFLLAYRGIPAGQRYLLNSKTMVKMGRNRQNDVPFDFADIAEFHLEIQWVGNNHHELLVLGHSMKTRVNEQPVLPLTRTILKNGDMIQVGEHVSFQYMVQAHPNNPPKGAYPNNPQNSGYPNNPQNSAYPNNPQNSAYPNNPPKGAYPNNPPKGAYPNNPQNSGYPNNPQQSEQAPIVVVQPNYPVRKEIPVIHIRSLTHPTRIGCKFCLHTLDPNDPDEKLRSVVKVGEHHYHQACYDQLEKKPAEAPVVASIAKIEPLLWHDMTPVVGDPGPTNTIDDVPLGISVGTANLSHHREFDFYIRNNTAYPISISRLGFVSWMYLHHHHTQVGYDFEYQLPPGDTRAITIVPHAVRPSFVTKEISLIGKEHVIDVASGSYSVTYIVSLMLGMVCLSAHFLILMLWSISPEPWAMLFFHLLMSVLMMWWVVYMIPGRLLEIGNRLMKGAFRLGNGVGKGVYKPMYRFIATGKLPTLMQNPADYIGFALVLALVTVGFIYIIPFALMTLLPSVLRFVFSLGYLVIIVHLFNMIIYDYNDDPIYFTQRLWRNSTQFIRDVQAMNAGDFSGRGTGT